MVNLHYNIIFSKQSTNLFKDYYIENIIFSKQSTNLFKDYYIENITNFYQSLFPEIIFLQIVHKNIGLWGK